MKITARLLILTFFLTAVSTFSSTAKKPATTAPSFVAVSGSIVDKDTQEELGGVYLYFQELHKGIFSDPDGSFTLKEVATGTYHVTVKFISYHDKSVSIKVEKGRKNFTKIVLDPVKP
jgi:hypothetical protein